MREEFRRSELLLGPQARERLAGAHAAVFGVGGVGGHAAEALARAGVGSLTLFDSDTVALSNINRQIAATHATLGQYKVDVMAARIRDINPDCRVTVLPVFYEPETREDFFSRGFDYIADCIDSTRSKLDLIETAITRGVPIISSMGTGNRLDPSKFRITDLSKTSGCPLAKVMRRELRARGIKHHTVLASEELPLTPRKLPGQEAERRTPPGSVSWVPPCAGMMIAGYIVQQLLTQKVPEQPTE